MPDIRQLPPNVINKIAAGEVIERPASVVKELMENSVDAGAARVDVSLEHGGAQLIRVADDGCGIAAEQFPLALASHATSKIRDADDLFRVGTLGFRGEALASIASVSTLRLRSRPAGVEAGAEAEVAAGQLGEIVPCGMAPGTAVEVRSLFFNTPVRRKFLRKTQTEMGHAAEAFARIALARPDIHFVLRHNERIVHDLAPVDSWRERIAALFGSDLSQSLIWVEGGGDDVRLRGYVADPQHSRSHNRMQYLFLNGRHIRDRSLQHALGEAYRGLLLSGRYPIVFLRLDMLPEVVDVNVHPTKLEVRFQDSGRVYSTLLGSIRNRFLTSDLSARIGSSHESGQPPEVPPPGVGGVGQAAAAAGQADDAARQALHWARQPSQSSLPLPSPAPSPGSAQVLDAIGRRTAAHPVGPPGAAPEPADDGAAGTDLPGPHRAEPMEAAEPWPAAHVTSPTPSAEPTFAPRAAPSGLQIHNRYLVTETEQGLVVIDQHALHERILYEQLRSKALAGQLETQRLLVPEPVTLSPREAAVVMEEAETLGRLGLNVEPFGGDTVLLTSYPAMLPKASPAELLRQAAELLLSGGQGPQRRDLIDELLHMMSCKAAIKAGDRLSPEEISALLDHRRLCQDSHHCPHGRPTSLVFTPEELDRRFKRT